MALLFSPTTEPFLCQEHDESVWNQQTQDMITTVTARKNGVCRAQLPCVWQWTSYSSCAWTARERQLSSPEE